jgi:hypothetical protein
LYYYPIEEAQQERYRWRLTNPETDPLENEKLYILLPAFFAYGSEVLTKMAITFIIIMASQDNARHKSQYIDTNRQLEIV